jgi:hypothetical protein
MGAGVALAGGAVGTGVGDVVVGADGCEVQLATSTATISRMKKARLIGRSMTGVLPTRLRAAPQSCRSHAAAGP